MDEVSVRKSWRMLLMEWEAARHYHFPYVLLGGHTFRNPLIEPLLPSLLYIKAAAILDDALEQVVSSRHTKLPSRYGDNLDGRIAFLGETGDVTDPAALHGVRKRRNALAHSEGDRAEWDELENALDTIEDCLISLTLVSKRPKLEFFGERSALEASEEDGVSATRKFTIGVRVDGKVGWEASWNEKLYDSDGSS
jgi:hypothetical protein